MDGGTDRQTDASLWEQRGYKKAPPPQKIIGVQRGGPSPMGASGGVRRGLLAALRGQLLRVGVRGHGGGGGELHHDPLRGTETPRRGGSPPKPPSSPQPWGSQWRLGRGWEGCGGGLGAAGGQLLPPLGQI